MARRRTHEEFMALVKDRPFAVLSCYVNSLTKVEFRCSHCENEWLAFPHNILKGGGCPRCAKMAAFGTNKIIEERDGWVLLEVTGSQGVYLDSDDYRRLVGTGIGRISVGGHGYPVCRYAGRLRLVHRLVFPNAKYVDHINGSPLDARRRNLRKCTHSQNLMNSSLSRSNTTGVKGVVRDSQSGKFRAQIRVNYKTIYLGVYDSIEQAAAARKAGEEKYHGRFARKL